MRIVTVVGARPQFVKAAVVSRALAAEGVAETLVHTGQHYDDALSQVFFDELEIPPPAVNLAVGSGSHARQTAETMMRLDAFLDAEAPFEALLVYGDTNATLAGALVAAKRGVPVVHVEAGLRSFNRAMPEELNRIATDRLSALLCCPTEAAVRHLEREGVAPERIHLTGDVMLDATRHYAARAATRAPLEALTPHAPGAYDLATIHRAENTDDKARLQALFDGLGRLPGPVVLPLHPRTRARLDGVAVPPNVAVRPPVGYLAMLTLVRGARRVLTDSGGLQKEALWLGTPCVTLRDETEWVETLEGGWNRLAGADAARIAALAAMAPETAAPAVGEPGAAARVAALIRHAAWTRASGAW